MDFSPRPLLMVFPFGLMSHYLRCLVLARELKKFFEIRFAFNSEYNHFIEAEGFSTFSCATFDEQEVIAKAAKFDFSWLNERDIEAVALSQAEVIKHYRPVAVLGDAISTLKLAAELCNVPYISLMNSYMSKFYKDQRFLSRTHPVHPYLKSLPTAIQGILTDIGERVAFKEIHKPFRSLRSKYGLKKFDNYFDETEGDYNMLCDLPYLFPLKPLPVNYFITGPLFYTEPASERSIREYPTNGKPTIFVGMGSTGQWKKLDFLNNDYYSRYNIITAGDKECILAAPHIIPTDFIHAESLFPHVDLVICHGGNGTIYQALSYEIPVLCKTSHFEQEWNVKAIEQRGLGQSLDDINDESVFRHIISLWITGKNNDKLSNISDKMSSGDYTPAKVAEKLSALLPATQIVEPVTNLLQHD